MRHTLGMHHEADDERDFGHGLAGLARVESSIQLATRYDQWAQRYDADLASWGYEVPQRLARELAQSSNDGPVLDAGCGTGLIGAAVVERFQAAGLPRTMMAGVDISAASLAEARRRGCYSQLIQADLLRPLPFADGQFGAVVCGGVMTYVPEPDHVLREFVRVTAPGGSVLFTQRTDLWEERHCDEVLAGLASTGLCTVQIDQARPYLPHADEYGDEILVIGVRLDIT